MEALGRVLFGGPAWPIGWAVGFVEKPFEDVYAAMRIWVDERDESSYDYRELAGMPIVDQLMLLAPLQQPPKRQVIASASGGWTAHFNNSILGGDPVSWVGYLSKHFDCQGVIASHIPQDQYPFPATQFQLFGPAGAEPLRYVRTVSAGIFDEGRWRFDVSGTEQPFEEREAYSRRLIRERLTREMLLRYLAALGLAADDPSSYGEGVLIETLAAWRSRVLPLQEARQQYAASAKRPRRR